MQHSDISPLRHTSVTLRTSTRNALRIAVFRLAKRKLKFSEQRLMRQCFRIALRLWRGHKDKARRNRRYNRKPGTYVIVPLYTTEALRSVAWLRCHHSGISLSRLMDFAIRHYLPRVLEQWLSAEHGDGDQDEAAIWKEKYNRRRNKAGFIISYNIRTYKHDAMTLNFEEKMEFEPWPPPRTVFTF